MDNIKAILFDFDNTLADRYTAAYRTVLNFLRDETDAPKDDPALIEAIAQDFLNVDQFGNNMHQNALEETVRKYDLKTNITDYWDWWKKNLFRETLVWPDTLPTLQKLSEKYRLGVISNGDSLAQHSKLRKAGLYDCFEMILISGEVGVMKPDSRIFEIGAERMNLRTDECAYVGDIFSNDIYGSYKAGMLPIWIFPSEQIRPMEYFQCIRINRFSDLLEVFHV